MSSPVENEAFIVNWAAYQQFSYLSVLNWRALTPAIGQTVTIPIQRGIPSHVHPRIDSPECLSISESLGTVPTDKRESFGK